MSGLITVFWPERDRDTEKESPHLSIFNKQKARISASFSLAGLSTVHITHAPRFILRMRSTSSRWRPKPGNDRPTSSALLAVRVNDRQIEMNETMNKIRAEHQLASRTGPQSNDRTIIKTVRVISVAVLVTLEPLLLSICISILSVSLSLGLSAV